MRVMSVTCDVFQELIFWLKTKASPKMLSMFVTCEVSQPLMSALNDALFANRLDISVTSDVSQSPMSSVKDIVPGPALQCGLAAQHWTPLGTFVRQLCMA